MPGYGELVVFEQIGVWGEAMEGSNGWYVAVDGSPTGPYLFEHLASLARAGRLTPDMLVWVEGMATWLPAADLPQLFPAMPPPLPVPPPLPPRDCTATSTPEGETLAARLQDDAALPPRDTSIVEPEKAVPAAEKPSGRKWIANPTTEADAIDAIKAGAVSGYIFACMYVLGGLITYFAARDLFSNQPVSDPVAELVGFLLVATIIWGSSYWFRKKHHIALELPPVPRTLS